MGLQRMAARGEPAVAGGPAAMTGDDRAPRVTARVRLGERPPVVRTPRWWARQVTIHAYIPETLLLVAALVVLDLGVLPANPGFLGIEPNPFFGVILLMGARYGFRAALLSAVLCTGAYYGLIVHGLALPIGRELASFTYARHPVLFMATGLVLGVIVQGHRDRIAALTAERNRRERELRRLAASEEKLRDVNEELAERVVSATETLPMLYRYAKKLNTRDREAIFTALSELVADVLKARRVSVYARQGDRLPLHSRNGQRVAGRGRDLELPAPLARLVLEQGRVVTLHDLLDLGLHRPDLYLCGPLRGADGAVAGVLAVEDLDFVRYHPATVRLFRVVVDWAAAALAAAEDRPAAGAAPAGEAQRGARAARGRRRRGGALGGLLGDAAAVLFSGPREVAGPHHAGPVAAAAGVVPSESGEMRNRLSGELARASAAGSPLARLLAEVDDYVTGRGRASS